jgi:hypothetical protein
VQSNVTRIKSLVNDSFEEFVMEVTGGKGTFRTGVGLGILETPDLQFD